jgi:VanZ family protein
MQIPRSQRMQWRRALLRGAWKDSRTLRALRMRESTGVGANHTGLLQYSDAGRERSLVPGGYGLQPVRSSAARQGLLSCSRTYETDGLVPQLLIVVALIVCGSLYPWHFAAPSANPWLILMRSWPQAWTLASLRDASANIVVYVPLGALAFLAAARRHSTRAAAAAAIVTGLLLSLSMELLQTCVPGRTSSLFDVATNVTGASVGVLAAWRFRSLGSRMRQPALPLVLMLVCWVWYHLTPFVPMFILSRMNFELTILLHPPSVSLIEIWSFTAEWIAAAIAAQMLFGSLRLRWLPMLLAFHLAVRPFFASRPLVFEEALGVILALILWKVLPEPVRSGPWLLISVILLRECAPFHAHGSAAKAAFSWVPFRAPLSANREYSIQYLSRFMFDYAAILWLWWRRGMPYEKSGAILAGALAGLAVMQRYLPGDAITMTDPVLVLLAALMFRLGS